MIFFKRARQDAAKVCTSAKSHKHPKDKKKTELKPLKTAKPQQDDLRWIDELEFLDAIFDDG